MYCKNSRAQSAARVKLEQIDPKVHIWSWFQVILLAGLVICVSKVTAGTHHVGNTTELLQKHRYAQTVGYNTDWTRQIKGVAEKAYKEDEYALAYRMWSMLAEAGNADAAYKLGMLFDIGNSDIRQDARRAAHWYMQAARAGHLHAQHNLAVAYASGDGVELDISKAISWWERAARQGNSDSQYNLGIVYAMGTHGIRRNLEQAKTWWRKAAMKGDPMAQYNLGTIYANGDGHVRSYCEAIRWWEKSASKGIQQASWALELVKTRQDFRACW